MIKREELGLGKVRCVCVVCVCVGVGMNLLAIFQKSNVKSNGEGK